MSRTLALALGLGSLAALAAAPAPAQAAPVNYNESVSGDIPAFGTPTKLLTFTLDRGTNTVSGRMGDLDSTAPPALDTDSFAFVIPAGLQLGGGGLTLTDAVGNVFLSRWVLYRGSDEFNGGTMIQDFQQLSPGTTAFANVPLPADVYNFSNVALSGNGLSDYTFTFTVVPEPASVALLGLGGFGLLARRRRP